MTIRRNPIDLEYFYALLSFFNRLGLISPQAHTLVMSVHELWRRITNKLIQNKKFNYSETAANRANNSMFSKYTGFG